MAEENVPAPRPTALTGAQTRALRAQAHHIKAIVWVGQHGLNDAVTRAVKTALLDHELIKVSLGGESAKERKALAALLAEQTGSHVVQTIGKVGVFYRQKKTDPIIKLPGVVHKKSGTSKVRPS